MKKYFDEFKWPWLKTAPLQSNIKYEADLDVLRAIAALMVFVWHYIHFQNLIEPRAYLPGIAVFEEGHIGVSLFMVLSGYLFTKITYGKVVDWPNFTWNRVVRIAPLLLITQGLWLVVAAIGIVKYSGPEFLTGFVMPTWIGAAWSITVELHFYLLLPLILALVGSQPSRVIMLLFAVVVLQYFVILEPSTRYNTILGRLDQFLIGSVLALYLHRIPIQFCYAGVFSLLIFMEAFNFGGGHYAYIDQENQFFSDRFPRWTAEAMGLACLIATVLKSNWSIKKSRVWQFLSWVGKISYSIYLTHLFLILAVFFLFNRYQVSSEIRLLMILPVSMLLLIGSALSYRLIELPFLKRRVKYIGVVQGKA